MGRSTHELLDILARNVRMAREKIGFSQQHLAEAADLSTGHVTDIEQARKWVSPESLQRLADALLVEPWMLLLPDQPGRSAADYDFMKLYASRIDKKVHDIVFETLRELMQRPEE
jgi:transcriptional regulator with XRE-family HTH domain